MSILLYLFAFFLSLGQLGRISFFNQQINIYLHEVLIFVSIGYSLVYFIVKKHVWRLDALGKAWIILSILFFLSLLPQIREFSLWENMIAFLYGGRFFLYALGFILLSQWVSFYKSASKVCIDALYLMLFLTILFSFVQYIAYPQLGNLSYLGWDPHYYRAFGLFFDTFLSGTWYTALFFMVDEKKPRFASLLLFILIVLSYSRASYLTFIIVFISYKGIARFFSIRNVLLVLILIGIIFVTLPKNIGESVNLTRSFTIESRLKDYKEGIRLFAMSPLVGHGYNRIQFFRGNLRDDSHGKSSFSSSHLTVLVTSGMIGVLLWGYWLYKIYHHIDPSAHPILTSFVIASFFDNVLLHTLTLGFLLLIILSYRRSSTL